MASICRLCLSTTANRYEPFTAIEEKYFQLILPEIDLHLVQSPTFCQCCIETLRTTYSFKTTCLATEKMLKLYASNHSGGGLLLSDVLEKHFAENVQIPPDKSDQETQFYAKVKTESDQCDLDLEQEDLENYEVDIKLSENEINLTDTSDTKTNWAKSFQCTDCGNSLPTKKLLIDHIKTHYEQPYCIRCNKIFSKRYGLKRHLSNIHKIKTDKEEEDDLYTLYPDKDKLDNSLKKHLKLYDNDENIFDYLESNSKNLGEQLSRPYKCNVCQKAYNIEKSLTDHIRTHFTRFECRHCGRGYYNEDMLKQHLTDIHKFEISNNIILKDHLTITVLESELEEALKTTSCQKFDDKQYQCSICNKSYEKRLFRQHIRLHFTESNCKLCGKRYFNIPTLKRHLHCVHEINLADDAWRDNITVVVDELQIAQALKQHNFEDVLTQTSELLEHKPFKCQKCEKSYSEKRSLREHIRRHFTRSDCALCNKQYFNIASVKRHLLCMHKIDVDWHENVTVAVDEPQMIEAFKKHDFEEAEYIEIVNKDVLIHEKPTTNDEQSAKPYKCDKCDKAYHNKAGLRDHIRRHFIRSDCRLCGKQYFNISTLKRHLVCVHKIDVSDDVSWRENIAVETVESEMKEALEKLDEIPYIKTDPLVIATDPVIIDFPKYGCKTCGKLLGSKWSLSKHALTHTVKKSVTCEYCQKGFLNKDRLRKHIYSIHLGVRPKYGNKDQNYVCDICGYKTSKKRALVDHKGRHTGEKRYKCDICDKAFRHTGSLYTHKSTVHSTERLFTCEYCSKSFNSKGSLTKHILQVHMGDKIEKKFVCNYCGKKYRLQNQLNGHLVWHRPDRPFSCDLCGKKFVDNNSVRKHRVIHFEKPYKCEICDKGFHYKYNVKVHMKVHGTVL